MHSPLMRGAVLPAGNRLRRLWHAVEVSVVALEQSGNRVRIRNGDSYEIRPNDDADLVVVICLALSVDASENQDDMASVSFDFGNIGPEDRPFEKIVGP